MTDGISCPACSCRDSRVIDSRGNPRGLFVRRRRRCTSCQVSFTTHETLVTDADRIVAIRSDFAADFTAPDSLSVSELNLKSARHLTAEQIQALPSPVLIMDCSNISIPQPVGVLMSVAAYENLRSTLLREALEETLKDLG